MDEVTYIFMIAEEIMCEYIAHRFRVLSFCYVPTAINRLSNVDLE